MKKIILFALTVVLLASLTRCYVLEVDRRGRGHGQERGYDRDRYHEKHERHGREGWRY